MDVDRPAGSFPHGFLGYPSPEPLIQAVDTGAPVRAESVDLLRMIPEANRSPTRTSGGQVIDPSDQQLQQQLQQQQDVSRSRAITANDAYISRSRMGVLDDEEEETGEGAQLCPHCRDHETVYLARMDPDVRYPCREAEDMCQLARLGGYLGNGAGGRVTSQSTTALYSRGPGRPRPPPQATRTLPPNAPKMTNFCSPGGCPRSPSPTNTRLHKNNASPNNNGLSFVTHTVMRDKSRRRVRLKKLLFLSCIIVGILVALTGIVVGFAVLAPYKNPGPGCAASYVTCAERGCLLLADICSGDEEDCVPTPYQRLCSSPYNDSSDRGQPNQGAHQSSYVTFYPNLEKVIRDDRGWSYYSKGSQSGSKYSIINRVLTFAAAQEECRKLGGYLTHVSTMREHIFLEDFLREELKLQEVSNYGDGFWIGARRGRGSHGGRCMYNQWKWTDAYERNLGAISGFTAFVPGKPDNAYDPEECLFMSTKEKETDNFLKWDDAPCDLPNVAPIKGLCEVELS